MNTVIVEQEVRRFQVWSYSVSMARLLLRSTKSEDFATRCDVLFQNVEAIKLPTVLNGLVVAAADPGETASILADIGSPLSEETTIFVVGAGTFNGYVVAGVCTMVEDEGEYFDPSSLWPEL